MGFYPYELVAEPSRRQGIVNELVVRAVVEKDLDADSKGSFVGFMFDDLVIISFYITI